MGERSARTTKRFENQDLVALTRKAIVDDDTVLAGSEPDDDDPLADWDDTVLEPVIASGSQPAALPTTSRTATVSDPLTTGVLAEVARRTQTVELDLERVDRRTVRDTQEIPPTTLDAVLADSKRS